MTVGNVFFSIWVDHHDPYRRVIAEIDDEIVVVNTPESFIRLLKSAPLSVTRDTDMVLNLFGKFGVHGGHIINASQQRQYPDVKGLADPIVAEEALTFFCHRIHGAIEKWTIYEDYKLDRVKVGQFRPYFVY